MAEISLGVFIASPEKYFRKRKWRPNTANIWSYEHHVDNFNEKYINTGRCGR